jgi:hypothetical protein
MRFSVVEIGYDQRQVDACLDELAAGVTRLAAHAEGATEADGPWERVRREATLLRDTLAGAGGGAAATATGARARGGAATGAASPAGRVPARVEREVGETLARARAELQAAREEARLVRERAYAEALQARRDFEAALEARRRREERVDEILHGTSVGLVPKETATAAAAVPTSGVPATRSAAAGATDPAAEPASERPGVTRVR